MHQTGAIEFSTTSSSSNSNQPRDGSAHSNLVDSDNPLRSVRPRIETSTKSAAEGIIPPSQQIMHPAPSRNRTHYSNLVSSEHKHQSVINVFGVLVSFSAGLKSVTKGSHKFSCTYGLIDMTKSNPHYPMKLTVFGDNPKDFPQHLQTGDIMRCINVKVDNYNNFQTLQGSDRTGLQIVSFHRKVNHLTGFPLRCQSDRGGGLMEGSGTGTGTGFLSSDWDVHFTTSTCPIFYTNDYDTVRNLNSWSEQVFIKSTLGDQGNPSMTLKNILSLPTERAEQRCDLVCMVVGVMFPTGNNNMNTKTGTTVLLWDGTTKGELTLFHPSIQQDMHISLQAAGVFAEGTNNCTRDDLLNLENRIELNPSPANMIALYGSPFVVSSMPSDNAVSAELIKLKVGMWIRLRNLHIDQAPVETQFQSFFQSPSNPINCSVVGYVHLDTHISQLLPYFRYKYEYINSLK
jgi:hypothetical protein